MHLYIAANANINMLLVILHRYPSAPAKLGSYEQLANL